MAGFEPAMPSEYVSTGHNRVRDIKQFSEQQRAVVREEVWHFGRFFAEFSVLI